MTVEINEPVYITGHCHPDTDSIASAIAYAFFRRARDGVKAVPCRLGEMNQETKYLLERFGYEPPILLKDARKTLAEIELDSPEYITPEMSVLETIRRMHELDRPSFAVLDEHQRIAGYISKSDLANLALSDTASEIELLRQTDVYHMAEAIDGKVLLDDRETHINGKVSLVAMSAEGTHNYDVKDRIVIVGNDAEAQIDLIEKGAGLLIIVWAKQVEERVLACAREHHCPILLSGHGSMNTSRYLFLSPPVRLLMREPIAFRDTDFAEEAARRMMKSRLRCYPVIDADNRLVGYMHRYHIMNYHNKRIILVDHNEFSQSVKAIEKAQILEVIDHHRINDFATSQPVAFRNEIVGSTATLITTMFRENQIPIPPALAGLLLGAVLSDTLNFQSPTTTEKDRSVGNLLAALAGLELDVFAREMFENAVAKDEAIPNLIIKDIKYFDIESFHTMISQILVGRVADIRGSETDIQRRMDELTAKKNLDLLVVAFTSVIDNGSVLFFAGEKASAAAEAFPDLPNETHSVQEGILSRKGQILPKIQAALGS